MGANQIHNCDTQLLDGPNGSTAAIMMGVDILEPSTADAFVAEVVQRVLMQRMVSPPQTSLLCITLMGPMTSSTFARLWQRHAAKLEALVAFMAQMTDADVIHGTPQGQVLDQTSLLAPAPSARPGPTTPSGKSGLWNKVRSVFGKS